MYSDDELVQELIALLKAHGVRHVVIAPGSRHYPITRSLEGDADFTLYSVVDERSAGFFAVGLIQSLGAPVATLCTSGTASINFGSAVVEAFYQKLPLLVLTPDRLPELLGQMEDQMFPQTNMFRDFTRYVGQVKPIKSELDRWYVNRVINESLLALTADGGGPVQLNIPILNPAERAFGTRQLPLTRHIKRHTLAAKESDWRATAQRLVGKRVMVIWGQGPRPTTELLAAFDLFAQRTDVVTLADHLSNLHHPTRVRLPLPYLRSPSARVPKMRPDIVITVGGNLVFQDAANDLLRGAPIEHWRVTEDGQVADPFRNLTDVFAMTPERFFAEIANAAPVPLASSQYAAHAHAIASTISPPPEVFGETAAIGRFLAQLSGDCVLHIANSAPIRMAQLYDVDPAVEVVGNRGINGIDGSMSAAIGYAVASDRINFLLIGDLAFFYDMNSLWIRHRPANLRIIVFNNDGGALMHSSWGSSPQVGAHVSAAHHTSVQGWVESVGIDYRSARNFADLDVALHELTRGSDGAMLVEVFTEKTSDIEQLKDYHTSISAAGATTRGRLRASLKALLRRFGLLAPVRRLLGRGR